MQKERKPNISTKRSGLHWIFLQGLGLVCDVRVCMVEGLNNENVVMLRYPTLMFKTHVSQPR